MSFSLKSLSPLLFNHFQSTQVKITSQSLKKSIISLSSNNPKPYHHHLQINQMSAAIDCSCKTAKKPTGPSVHQEATVPKKVITTPQAPSPVGPYNQAVALERTLYVSGCLGLNKDTMKLVEGGAAAEARQALTSLGHILQAGGSNYANVLKTTIFLDDIGEFGAVNEVYKEFFVKDYPARSCFQVGKLPLGAKVEIEAIAGIP